VARGEGGRRTAGLGRRRWEEVGGRGVEVRSKVAKRGGRGKCRKGRRKERFGGE